MSRLSKKDTDYLIIKEKGCCGFSCEICYYRNNNIFSTSVCNLEKYENPESKTLYTSDKVNLITNLENKKKLKMLKRILKC